MMKEGGIGGRPRCGGCGEVGRLTAAARACPVVRRGEGGGSAPNGSAPGARLCPSPPASHSAGPGCWFQARLLARCGEGGVRAGERGGGGGSGGRKVAFVRRHLGGVWPAGERSSASPRAAGGEAAPRPPPAGVPPRALRDWVLRRSAPRSPSRLA